MSDSKETLICPACGKEMHKIFVNEANCNVDVCLDGCGGIFFDNRKFKKFDEKHENIDELQKVFEGKTFIDVDKTFKRVCPVCGMKMFKNSTSISQKIVIDECYSCGGKFLDYRELDEIRAEYETEKDRSDAVVNFLKDKMGSEFEEMNAYQKSGGLTKQEDDSFIMKIIKKHFI